MPSVNDDTLKLTFIYSTGVINLAAAIGAVGNGTVLIGADADFKCNYYTAHVIQAGVLVFNWAGTVIIKDSAVGRDLSNVAIPLEAIRGTGELPYPLNPPRLFSANSSVVVTLTNSVAVATAVHICFHGNKIYPNERSMYTGTQI